MTDGTAAYLDTLIITDLPPSDEARSFAETVVSSFQRHACHLVMGGVPLMVVARLLEHIPTGMVEKHYGHLPRQAVDRSVADKPRFGTVSTSNVACIESHRQAHLARYV